MTTFQGKMKTLVRSYRLRRTFHISTRMKATITTCEQFLMLSIFHHFLKKTSTFAVSPCLRIYQFSDV